MTRENEYTIHTTTQDLSCKKSLWGKIPTRNEDYALPFSIECKYKEMGTVCGVTNPSTPIIDTVGYGMESQSWTPSKALQMPHNNEKTWNL